MDEPNQLKITYVSIEELIPYVKNARVHSEEQVKQIAQSIIEFGFCDPVALDGENVIIEGHGRLMAAKLLVSYGYDEHKKVPTIQLSHFSERQKKAYILAHNRLPQNATWDFKMLSEELDEIVNSDFNIDIIGFDEQEVDALLKQDMGVVAGLSDFEPKPEKKEKITKNEKASKLVHTCPHCNGTFSAK